MATGLHRAGGAEAEDGFDALAHGFQMISVILQAANDFGQRVAGTTTTEFVLKMLTP